METLNKALLFSVMYIFFFFNKDGILSGCSSTCNPSTQEAEVRKLKDHKFKPILGNIARYCQEKEK
jgi:hypothetical protein